MLKGTASGNAGKASAALAALRSSRRRCARMARVRAARCGSAYGGRARLLDLLAERAALRQARLAAGRLAQHGRARAAEHDGRRMAEHGGAGEREKNARERQAATREKVRPLLVRHAGQHGRASSSRNARTTSEAAAVVALHASARSPSGSILRQDSAQPSPCSAQLVEMRPATLSSTSNCVRLSVLHMRALQACVAACAVLCVHREAARA